MRPQTLLLVSAIALLIAGLFVPLVVLEVANDQLKATIEVTGNGYNFSVLKALTDAAATTDAQKPSIDRLTLQPGILAGLLAVGVVLPFMALWRYRRREEMLRFTIIGVVYQFMAGLFTAGFVYFLQADIINMGYQITSTNAAYGLFLPAFALIQMFFASHFIQKDIRKVRSADRFW